MRAVIFLHRSHAVALGQIVRRPRVLMLIASFGSIDMLGES